MPQVKKWNKYAFTLKYNVGNWDDPALRDIYQGILDKYNLYVDFKLGEHVFEVLDRHDQPTRLHVHGVFECTGHFNFERLHYLKGIHLWSTDYIDDIWKAYMHKHDHQQLEQDEAPDSDPDSDCAPAAEAPIPKKKFF